MVPSVCAVGLFAHRTLFKVKALPPPTIKACPYSPAHPQKSRRLPLR